jgi:outer membrane protein assembly factor BamD (BamD/ComL family)
MSSDGAREPQNWKVKRQDGSRLEPANLTVLRQWVASHQIEADDLVINDDLSDWIRAAEAFELFDLFEKQEVHIEPDELSLPQEQEPEIQIEIPDCAFHPGRAATEICVGCGKFVCNECSDRFENKLYCRGCLAEKQVGVEPGAPAGPGAVAQIIPGVRQSPKRNRLSLASLVLAVVAICTSFLLLLPGFRMATAPVIGFISFLAALFGAISLSNIRTGRVSSRSRQFAMAGLLAGLSMLILSIYTMSVSIREFRASGGNLARRNQTERILPQSGRRQTGPLTESERAEREANARQMLEQVAEFLKAGQLEQAVSASRTLIGLYPDTEAGKRVEENLPLLEKALAEKQAQEKAVLEQNEDLARPRLDQAERLYGEGNQTTAIDLLKSVVEAYPETQAAVSARDELQKIEAALTYERMKTQEQEAAELAQRAKKLLEAEQFSDAASLYGRIVNQYAGTRAAASVREDYRRAQLLASDPSEREFFNLQKRLPEQTYEQTIENLQEFLMQYPESAHFEEAKKMLQENQTKKTTADSLYTFGRAYMSEKKYSLALGRYEKLIEEHPRSKWIPQARKDYELAQEKLKE